MSSFGDEQLNYMAQTLEEIESSLRGINFNLSELQKAFKHANGLDPKRNVDEQLGRK